MLHSIFCKQIFAHIWKHKVILFNEKQKMLNGKNYNPALDYTLFRERLKCKKLCYEYNNLSPEKIRERTRLISKILGKTKETFLLEQPFMCDYGYNIEIGSNFCSNHNLLILDSAKVILGDNVLVGPNCGFYTTIHPANTEMRARGVQCAKPIVVADNVWICAGVTVVGGVTIGKNSIIGAGSVVTRDIPENSFAVGNPCKVVKELS